MSTAAATGLTAYAAFLRGINIGGHKQVGMRELKASLEAMGFRAVGTILASGNAVFSAPRCGTGEIAAQIQGKLRETFGTDIAVMVRTLAHLRAIAAAEPFKGVKVTPETRLLVTFTVEKPKIAHPLPYAPRGGDFRIIQVSTGEILTVLTVRPGATTPDFLKFLDHEIGRGVTTRTWSTLLRVLAA